MKQQWDMVPFEDAPLQIVDGDRGKAYPKHGDLSDSGYCLFLSATNVTAHGFAFSECQFISEQKDHELRKGRLSRHDVVLTTRGTIGNVAFYGDGVPYDHMRINSGMVILRTDPNKLLPQFLYGYLRSPSFAGQVEQLRSGVAQPQLPIRDINKIRLPVPARDVQQRVVDVFGAYDDLIDNNRRRIALLEEAARQLHCEWFVRFRFPGHERVRLLNGVPEGWEPKRLGDLCNEIRDSVSPSAVEPDTPYIGLEHMPRRSISLGEWGSAEQVTSSKHRFREGDVLFGKIRPYFHKVGLAFLDGVASSDAIVIRAKSDEWRSLLLMTVSSDEFVKDTAQSMREGSKMPRADWTTMTQYPVPLPPAALLDAFSGVVTVIAQQLRNLCLQNRALVEARGLLLPRLLSGEIAA